MAKRRSSLVILILIVIAFGDLSFSEDSRNVSALFRRAKQEVETQNFSQAIQTYEDAVRLEPANQAAASGLLYCLLKTRQFPQAIAFGREATAKFNDNAELHHWLGLAYFESGDLSAGEDQLVRAIALNADNYDSFFDLAMIRLTKKDYKGAASSLQSALRLKPGEALPHVLLGRAYVNSNRTLMAIEQFKTAARLDPKLVLVHYHLGYAYESLGRNREAIEQYRTELARDKNNAEVLGQLGHVLTASGDWREASQYLERALEMQPERADWIYALAKADLRLGNVQGSSQLLKRYVVQRPDDPSGHYLLAEALEKSGNREQALLEMQKFQQASRSQHLVGASASAPQ